MVCFLACVLVVLLEKHWVIWGSGVKFEVCWILVAGGVSGVGCTIAGISVIIYGFDEDVDYDFLDC